MNELDQLKVYGPTEVGWCSKTPANETMDANGIPSVETLGFPARDPRAPTRRVFDDPEVDRLREHLRNHNGLHGVEICESHEIDRALGIFHRDGFVVVKDLLSSEQLAKWREACASELKKILEHPGSGGRKYLTETSRLPHRYSYGTSSASRQLLHDPVWASMVDLPTTTPLLEKIMAGSDYFVLGAGGDLCLPGAVEYQTLHADLQESYEFSEGRLQQAQALGINLRTRDNGSLDSRTEQLILTRTPPLVTINFLMTDLTWENGPIRQIPGTHGAAARPPTQTEEPEWMRLSTLVGAPAGAGVFRDNRAWHGATPNLSREIRAMPNVEYGAPWLEPASFQRTMPHEIWQTLTPHGQHLARRIKAEPGVWPAGAGIMHPLQSKRAAANPSAPRVGRRTAYEQ